jgi:O-antigen biosynthesis protein
MADAVSRPTPPDASVVVPVRDGAAFVADAIESVLAQAGASLEIVVVDDGSTDATPEVLARYADRVRVVRRERGGISAARNTGIDHATADWLLFLDADDLQPPGFVARRLAAARAEPEIDAFYGAWRWTDFAGRTWRDFETPATLDDDPFHAIVAGGSPQIGTLMVRRAAVERTGGFDTGLDVQEDWDFWLRLAASGARFRRVGGESLLVRRTPRSSSLRAGVRLAWLGLEILERQLARHGRCSRCAHVDAALETWRRGALRVTAVDLAVRLGLEGRTGAGRWIGLALAAARHPRFGGVALRELRAGFARPRAREDARAPAAGPGAATAAEGALPALLRHQPALAVVLAVRDAAASVDAAINGVLAQAGVDVELLVVDDGSTDATPERLAGCLAGHGARLRLLRQEPRGLAAARNAGIALTRSPLLLFLDVEDRLPAGYLARFLAAAAAAPAIEVFHCGWREIDSSGRVLGEQSSPLALDDDPSRGLVARGAPRLGATMVRRAALTRAGQFDERLPERRDPGPWLRLAASGAAFRGVPENLLTVGHRARGR